MEHRGSLLQLGLVWLTGSLTMGTLALVMISGTPAGQLLSLAALQPGGRALVYLLLLALVGGMLVVGWQTAGTSWLTDDPRARLLWALAVAGLGSAGFVYAGLVTIVADFPYGAKLVLGYAGGGLPFALIAAMLQRSLKVNAVAAGAALTGLVVGVFVAGVGFFPLITICLMQLSSVFNPFHAL